MIDDDDTVLSYFKLHNVKANFSARQIYDFFPV